MHLRRLKSLSSARFTIGRAVDRPLYRCVYRGGRTYGCGDTAFSVGDHRAITKVGVYFTSTCAKALKRAGLLMVSVTSRIMGLTWTRQKKARKGNSCIDARTLFWGVKEE